MAHTLKKQYVEQIKVDSILLGTVAAAADVTPATILTWIRKGSVSLTLISVVIAIKEYNQLGTIEEVVDRFDDSMKEAA